MPRLYILKFSFVSLILWLNLLPSIVPAQGNFVGKIDRALRYRPENRDFVIENGREFFNRPLYGGNTAFRVDAGDKPEFLLYLPGRGGNLRFGIRTAKGQKWLNDADKIVARYRPGSMIYEISDALLGKGILNLKVLATNETEGLIIRAELKSTAEKIELITAYGGANGARGRRNGDIGTEAVPIGEFFQFKPEIAQDNKFSITDNSFALESKIAEIAGITPESTKLEVRDANKWSSLSELLTSPPNSDLPLLVGITPIDPDRPGYFYWQKFAPKTESKNIYQLAELPQVFERTELHFQTLSERVLVETPDPFINAAAAALNVAADAIWDEPQAAYMHGSVAWRNKLLGWRGPYAGDALGWHDRMRKHLQYWATRQNVSPISSGPVKPDPKENFARNEHELHSNGDISNSHYDMNLVYIDALFRHILWTGDVEFARQVFPVIRRHLAWERRLFRREFGPEKLPLYEAYVCIWASDDLQYHGGGVTHSTAYNYYHNKMAARIARLTGEDATPYEREAELISKALRQHLWLENKGWFGEFKDLLGLQKIHENAALWTFYHTVDSEIPIPSEAWQMTRFVDTQIPHIPIRGENIPPGDFATISTTSWMPYTWSTNNVVMSEVMHTALGYWQTGRHDEAFKLYKSAILDSMFLGICPGNVGSMTYFDVYRRESQRDFADPVGTKSRALIEGLFGIKPDLLGEELIVSPGFQSGWNHAAIKHPDFNFSFKRNNLKDTYRLETKFSKTLALRLRLSARRDGIERITVNGKKAGWKADEDSIGGPRIEILGEKSARYEVEIVWKGEKIRETKVPQIVAENSKFSVSFGKTELLEISDPQQSVQNPEKTTNSFSAVASRNPGHRTVFAKLRQGEMRWHEPLMFEIRPAFEIMPSENQDQDSLRFKVRNNTSLAVDKKVTVDINGETEKLDLKVLPLSESTEIAVRSKAISPGANRLKIALENGRSLEGIVTNWHIKTAAPKYEALNLTPVFNDKVAKIFKNEYLSPRSPYVSLAIPKQGIGSWARWNEQFEVDDSGLRRIAEENKGNFALPNGIYFKTTGVKDEKNIAFTSQWDNFPREVSVPLGGRSPKIYLLMAGSTNQMQSRFVNGEIIITYADNSTEKLELINPTNWWPIDQDYLIDDYAFRRPEAIPPRVELKTGMVRIVNPADFKGRGKKVEGGAATVLDLPLDANKELRSVTVRTLANEVIIGLMSATLLRN
jgi:hypothetical protein